MVTSAKKMEPETRRAAREAAERAGMTLGQYLNHLILEADSSSSELSDLLLEKAQSGQDQMADRFAENQKSLYADDPEEFDLDDTAGDILSARRSRHDDDFLDNDLIDDDLIDISEEDEDVSRIQDHEVSALRSALDDLARYDDKADPMSSEQAFAPKRPMSDPIDDDDDLLYTEEEEPDTSAFASAKSMMGEIAVRLERIESEITQGPDTHWTDKIETLAEQVERSETYMVGGLLAVEKALTKLDTRADHLEKNQQSTQKIGTLVEHMATHFQRFEDSTGHKIDTIASIVTELDDRVSGLENQQSVNGVDPIADQRRAPVSDPDVFDPFENKAPEEDTYTEISFGDLRPAPDAPDLRDPSSLVDEHLRTENAGERPFLRNHEAEGSFGKRVEQAKTERPAPGTGHSRGSDAPFETPDFGRFDDSADQRDARETRILESFLNGRTDTDFEIDENKYAQPGLQRPNVLSEFRASTIGIVGASFLAIAAAGYYVFNDRLGEKDVAPIAEVPMLDGPSAADIASNSQTPPNDLQTGPSLQDGQALEDLAAAASPVQTPPQGTPEESGNAAQQRAEAPTPSNPTSEADPLGNENAESSPLPPNILSGSSIAKLEERANSGDENAQLFLGIKHLSGSGVARDEVRGADLITQAAAQGSAPAQYRLGALYEQGVGVSQDYSLSKFWYEKAALSGNRKAMHNLAVLYAEGKGVPQDYGIAAQWFQKAAELDLTDSQYNLGILLKRGFGVEQNYVEAYKWFDVAARKGDQAAQEQLNAVSQELDQISLERAGSLVETWQPSTFDQTSNFDRFF